jgi:probable F420-dependent oxidoreductase
VAVVLEGDRDRARRVARAHLGAYLELANYRGNLARLGYSDEDFADGGSDRLVDAVVARGSTEQVTAHLHAHLDAGADHVAVQVLTAEPDRLPLAEWRLLASAVHGR